MEGPACLCQPPSSLPAWHTEGKDRVSQQHLACRFSFLYLVISNKRKVAVGRVSSLLYVLCPRGKSPGDGWWLC